MTRQKFEWFWKSGKSRPLGNFVYLRVAVPGEEELGKWLAARARRMIDQIPRFGADRNLSLSLVDDREIRAINAEWREKDQHTDVLSFPLGINVDSIGDVVISLDTARRQAREGGWALEKELLRLLAHGLAHCAGHTHDKPYEALRMAQEERGLLGEYGMVGDTYILKWGSTKRFVQLAEKQRLREREKERVDKIRRMAEREAFRKRRAVERAAERAAIEARKAERLRLREERERSGKKRVSTRVEKR